MHVDYKNKKNLKWYTERRAVSLQATIKLFIYTTVLLCVKNAIQFDITAHCCMPFTNEVIGVIIVILA